MGKIDKLLTLAQAHMESGERPDAVVLGTYEADWMGTEIARTGVMIATAGRVIFFAKKLTGHEVESFPYQNISSFESGKDVLGAKISFFASGNRVSLKWIQEGDLRAFVEVVRTRMGKPAPSAVSESASPTSIADRLRDLKALFDEGLITAEEFDSTRIKLVGEL